MNKKSCKSYSHVFKYINTEVIELNGATFISDYEQSLRKAILNVFEGSKMYGCWFHYCQAVRRQITTKNKELAKFIRNNKKASLQYHKILSLPLLPPSHIKNSFDVIKTETEKFDHQFNFVSFFTYFENQWLVKVRE